MKEFCNISEILDDIYYELFRNRLNELEKQRPFLLVNTVVSIEEIAVFLLHLKEKFNLSDEMIINIISHKNFSFNDICDLLYISIKNI